MKKLIIAISAAAILSACSVIAPDPTTKEGAQEIASTWIENNAPTYVFDGSNLERTKIYPLSCENCWKFEFVFESSHGGYGDRTNEVTTEVITDHIIDVIVEDGEVTGAVTDDTFDEFQAALGNTPADDESADQ